MEPIDRWMAPDGTPLVLRPLGAGDAPALQAMVEALPPQDRRRRFHGAVRALSPAWLARLADDGAPGRVALGVFGGTAATAPLLAELRCEADAGSLDAEFAIAVADGWRRRGLATRGLAALRRVAAERGLRWLHGQVLADNAPMLALMQRCGFRCTLRRGGLVVVEARCEAPFARLVPRAASAVACHA